MTPDELLANLSDPLLEIEAAIDAAQLDYTILLSDVEGRLMDMLTAIYPDLFVINGKLYASPENAAILAQVDSIWKKWQQAYYLPFLGNLAKKMVSVANLTGDLYADLPGVDKDAVGRTRQDASLALSALGITTLGNIIPGSIFWEIAQAAEVRFAIKDVILSGIQAGYTVRRLASTLGQFLTGIPGRLGRLLQWFQKIHVFDLFNRVTEIKNEQFRDVLGLGWLLYAGDIIKDSRAFCISKAGKIFAVVEADKEWPEDPDLVGKNSGIPYTPRVDRGRWNCRHRIRYITRELAFQLDPVKVRAMEKKYKLAA